MTTDKDTTAAAPGQPRWVRKLLVSGAIGGVAGFAGASAMLRFIDSGAVGGLGLSATFAALVGTLYLVIGIGIVIGTARPKMGVRFLNVEDADELREQQRMLSLSGWSMVVFGVALIALALAAPDGPVPQAAALAIALAGLAIGTVLSVLVSRACDELMLAVNLESGALSYTLMFAVVGSWATCAHLGLAAPPAPLDLLTLFYVLVLVASFIVVGRRGMLTVR